ncbi:MAG: thioesterase family protein [Cyclobacteriaceae bacterium]|nr:thioesterase family protein [Cyclobacteriaceae bacterium]
MARIKLNLPSDYIFKTEIPVLVTDINYGNHMGNDTVLSKAHEARLRFFISLGYKDELDFEDGLGIVIADAVVVYKSEAFYGDVLQVSIAVDEHNKYGFDMFYLFRNKQTGKEVARAKTGIVFFNYAERKVAKVPVALLEKLQSIRSKPNPGLSDGSM